MKDTALIEYCGCGMYRYIDSDGIEHILREPVKCNDCKFWGTEQDGYCAAIDDPYMLETEAEDFCSWGEKK